MTAVHNRARRREKQMAEALGTERVVYRPRFQRAPEAWGDTYEAFLARKTPASRPHGLERVPELHAALFPFQRSMVGWALRQGRAALFADTGLGKTLSQLTWASHVPGPTLTLAPLAVAQQTAREAARFGIAAEYAKEMPERLGQITITNYERLDRFDTSRFAGVVLDESSILKAYTGTRKRQLCEAFASTPFRLACTATPAPNDHLELGNHSEFLGVLSSHEMIARWFVNDSSTFGTYRLKGHAVEPFWDWVTSWARCVGMPSDLGPFDDTAYVLPELRVHRHVVDVDVVAGRGDTLFRIPEMSATSVHREKRLSVAERARRVAQLVAAEPDESWLIWCDTDYESDALQEALPAAVDVRGSMSLEAKERSLLGFVDGAVRYLVTKPKLAGLGLNFQHCARVAFVGATFSFESYYQAIRRCWRFGQLRPVDVHVVMGNTEAPVWDVLQEKARAHERMKAAMFAAARRAQAKRDEARHAYEGDRIPTMPTWLEGE